MDTVRRRLLRSASNVLALPAVIRAAWAETYPSRPITFVVPWPAGGMTDSVLRTLAAAAERDLGQPIVILNKPGASSTLGTAFVAAARPDGYIIGQLSLAMVIASLDGKTRYHPVHDFSHIIGVSAYVFGVVVRADQPWQSFQEFLEDARRNPGKLAYGTPGAGTITHIVMEEIARRQGIEWTHVPFKGNAESNSALLGGHVHAIADSTAWAQQVAPDRCRLLVTWGRERTSKFPAVPTLREIGIDIVADAPYGIVGPRGMEPATVGLIHDAFKKALDAPSFVALLHKLDQEPSYMDSASYRAFQETLLKERWLNQNISR
jgi:tripartite-type tricarboxylate transporter receptor subunit TctC